MTEKFVCVVKTSLLTLSQMLEVASLADVGKYAEELLSYMCSTIGPEPATTVLCVQQVVYLIYWLLFYAVVLHYSSLFVVVWCCNYVELDLRRH